MSSVMALWRASLAYAARQPLRPFSMLTSRRAASVSPLDTAPRTITHPSLTKARCSVADSSGGRRASLALAAADPGGAAAGSRWAAMRPSLRRPAGGAAPTI